MLDTRKDLFNVLPVDDSEVVDMVAGDVFDGGVSCETEELGQLHMTVDDRR